MRAAGTLLLAALAAVWLTLRLAGATAAVGPVQVRWQLSLSRSGSTELQLPPFGSVTAATHRTPVSISLMAERFRGQSTKDLLAALENRDTTRRQMEQDARVAVRSAVGRLLWIGLLCGLLFGRLASPREWRQAGGSALLTVTLLVIIGAGTAASYDRRAFRHLQYTGVLSEAPQALDLVRRGLADEQRLRQQIGYATTNLARFYQVLERSPSTEQGPLIRVLHVSDLHNNSAGLQFMRTLARQYHADEIVCTGDLTDYGTAEENRFVQAWGAPAPGSLFVLGNHDSQTTLAALRRLPRAMVPADGTVIGAAGLRFVGWADPSSARAGLGSVDTDDVQLAGLERRIRAALPRLQPRPDVLMLHNYRVAEALAGTVPLILYGHDHRPRITQQAGSVLVDAGTTGAAGTRYFTVESPPPYSAVLLTFRRAPHPHLLAADLISLREPEDSFTVEHFRLDSGAVR